MVGGTIAGVVISGIGIVANLIIVIAFLLHFRPFSAPILTLFVLAISDGALLINAEILTFINEAKIVCLPLMQVIS